MQELVTLLEWINLESPTSHQAGVNAMMDLAQADCTRNGLATERVAGTDGMGDMLVVRAGPQIADNGVLVLAHLDTVHPCGTKEVNLAVRIDGDRLYGPGAYDMKGGAWIALEAIKEVARTKSASSPITLLFTPDEEIGSPTSRRLIEDLARRSAAVLVPEPARNNGSCVTGRKGVGRFDIEIYGREAHAGLNHNLGRSAISEAARQILDIEAMTDYQRGATMTIGMVKGGSAANVIPRQASFSVDLRVATMEDAAFYEHRIRGLKPYDPDVMVIVNGSMNRPPMERTLAGVALYEKARELAANIGFLLPEQRLSGGGSDGNFTAALGIPTLDGLGVDGDGAHTLREHLLISSIEPRRRLLVRLLQSSLRS